MENVIETAASGSREAAAGDRRAGRKLRLLLSPLLRGFYKLMPQRPSIDPTFIASETLPEPQRTLLVHYSDMTSTLARHYGESIVLRPLDRLEEPKWYRRHIVLETATSHRPVEYGAMRVLLPLLSEAERRRKCFEAKLPLGLQFSPGTG